MKEFDPSGFDFDHPSPLFRFEDSLKGLVGGPLYYAPYFRSRGGFRGDEQVLDFGCGGGVSTRCIAAQLDRGGSVTGVEISAYFSEKARQRVSGLPNARILHGELPDLDLPRQSFDLVSIIHVIHDIPKPGRAPTMQTLGALLKPGGRLWIWEPTRATHGMPAAELRSLLEQAGLREVSGQQRDSSFLGVFEKQARRG